MIKNAVINIIVVDSLAFEFVLEWKRVVDSQLHSFPSCPFPDSKCCAVCDYVLCWLDHRIHIRLAIDTRHSVDIPSGGFVWSNVQQAV